MIALKSLRTTFTALLLAGLALPLAPRAAHAAKFANQFTEFELPPQWQCNLEGAEWVCQSNDPTKKRDAIIVLAAKLKGDQDSLEQYLAYLNSPKTYTSVQGKPVKSEKKWAKYETINDQKWVDSMHLESEVPGFFTRYLATVKTDIGVLVTYSVNKDKYSQYQADFENMVKTLKVFRKPGAINVAGSGTNLFSNTQIPAMIEQGSIFGNPIAGGSDEKPRPRPKEDNSMFYLLVGAAVIGFIIWRKRRQ